ncbi:MAG: major tail protein [Paraclostridium sp.]
MSRIIGCEGLHFALLTPETDIAGGKPVWETPVAVPSLIGIDIADNKETVEFYSDNRLEQVISAFSGKEVSIELGYLSKEVESMISGNRYEEGVYIQDANAVAGEIALMFKAPLSRGGFRYVCLYKGILAKDESNYKTKEDSVEGQTITLSGVFAPLASNGIPAIEVDDTDKSLTPAQRTMIEGWFTKVPEFVASAGSLNTKEAKK